MEIKLVQGAFKQIKEQPLIHEEIINELYRKNGLSHLHLLEGFMMSDKESLIQPNQLKYIENKIAEIEKQESDILEQRNLDIIHKKRQIKWFYPMIVVSFIGLIVTGFVAWNNYSKAEKQKLVIEQLQSEIKFIKQSISNQIIKTK